MERRHSYTTRAFLTLHHACEVPVGVPCGPELLRGRDADGGIINTVNAGKSKYPPHAHSEFFLLFLGCAEPLSAAFYVTLARHTPQCCVCYCATVPK